MRSAVIPAILLAFGLIAAHQPTAFGAEKTLQQLLVEKGAITKEEAAATQESVPAKWVDRFTFFGDLRVRHDSTWYSADPGTGDDGADRHRPRFRLRLGTQLKIKDLLIVVQLASGTGDATGNNQSFDNMSSQKQIWIQQASIAWNPGSARWVTLIAGKMANPFFTIESSDIVWDTDVTPEGVAEKFRFKPGDTVTIFFNAAQAVLDEDATTSHDQWLLGQQLGVVVEQTPALKTTLAAAFYEILNATSGTFGQTLIADGNSRLDPVTCTPGVSSPTPTGATPGCALVNRYHILDLTGEIQTTAGPLPLAIMGNYVRNLADTTLSGNGVGPATGNVGYQVGAILGKASDPHTWELAYFYKVVETDATLADMADSDFGDGGTNRRGHITWAAYNLTKYFQAKTKLFVSKSDGVLKDDITKLQVDAVVKF